MRPCQSGRLRCVPLGAAIAAMFVSVSGHAMGWYRTPMIAQPIGSAFPADGMQQREQPRGTACLYVDWGFRGAQRCYSPGERIEVLPASVDKAFSAVRLSGNVKVLAYTGPHGGGKLIELTRTGDHRYLDDNGAHDTIRSLQVVRTKPACMDDCPIPSGDAFDLHDMLKSHAGFNDARVQAVLWLRVDRQAAWRVRHGDTNQVELRGGRLRVQGGAPPSRLADQAIDARTASAMVTLEMNRSAREARSLGIHIVQLDADRKVVAATPILTTAWPTAHAGVVSISNLGPQDAAAVLLSSLSVWRVHGQGRPTRGVHCNAAWPLALLNLLAGTCLGQGSGNHYDGRVELVAGQMPPVRPTVATPQPARRGSGAVLAEVLHTHGKNPLAVYAAARACEIPVRALLAPRMRRGDSASGCSYNMMTIITLYLAMFRQQNGVEHFVDVIRRIMDSGTTGAVAADGAQQAALVDAVREQAEWLRHQPGPSSADPLAFFRRAYRHGVSLAAVSANRTLDPELAARRASDNAQACPATALTNWVQQQRNGDITEYLFDLMGFVEAGVQPQVWRQATSSWQWEPNDVFTFLVVTEQNQEAEFGSLMQSLQSWHEGYRETQLSLSASGSVVQAQQVEWLASQTALMAHYLRTMNSSRRIYVAARFRGQIVAIAEAWISKDDPGEAVLESIVVPPAVIREPYADGTVRRAAFAAVTRLFGWLHERGVRTVVAEATSEAANQVCTRIAFTFTRQREYMRDDRGNHSDDDWQR